MYIVESNKMNNTTTKIKILLDGFNCRVEMPEKSMNFMTDQYQLLNLNKRKKIDWKENEEPQGLAKHKN